MTLIKRPTKVELEGVGALTVRPSDYMTQGGEGAIYRKNGRILKLALDPTELRRSGKPEKIKLLRSRLSHPSIIVPCGMVLDGHDEPIGYHLPFVEGEPYPRLFTNDWRNTNHFGDSETTKLASTMHEVVSHAHQAHVLMVDANELNWLANVRNIDRPIPYVIDVDSWQIDHFAATVVMPSIRDWQSPITEASDWFAWGVVTFLLYTGIHPYKGKLDGYKPGELERRMRENASVFRPEVRLNRAVRDFKVIPGPLLDWYRSTFEDGERTKPPSPLQTGIAHTAPGRVLRVVQTTTGGLAYEELLRIPGEDVISLWPCGVVRTNTDHLVEVGSKRTLTHLSGTRAAVVKRDGGYLIAEEIGTAWQFRFVTLAGTEHALTCNLPIEQVVRSGERLFAITETELVEIVLQAFSKPILATGARWQVLGKSTRWFQGIGVSDVLGAIHLVLPFENDGVVMMRARELDGLRTVNAKALGRIASVIAVDSSGQYRAFEFAGSSDWRSYSVVVRDVDGPELNLAILPKGVTAEIREDSELIVCVPTQGTVKVVNDKDLYTTMQLGNIGDRVVYRNQGALWSLKMQ